jgi:hypothetical protein
VQARQFTGLFIVDFSVEVTANAIPFASVLPEFDVLKRIAAAIGNMHPQLSRGQAGSTA